MSSIQEIPFEEKRRIFTILVAYDHFQCQKCGLIVKGNYVVDEKDQTITIRACPRCEGKTWKTWVGEVGEDVTIEVQIHKQEGRLENASYWRRIRKARNPRGGDSTD